MKPRPTFLRRRARPLVRLGAGRRPRDLGVDRPEHRSGSVPDPDRILIPIRPRSRSRSRSCPRSCPLIPIRPRSRPRLLRPACATRVCATASPAAAVGAIATPRGGPTSAYAASGAQIAGAPSIAPAATTVRQMRAFATLPNDLAFGSDIETSSPPVVPRRHPSPPLPSSRARRGPGSYPPPP
jgi:hypothetical protein